MEIGARLRQPAGCYGAKAAPWRRPTLGSDSRALAPSPCPPLGGAPEENVALAQSLRTIIEGWAAGEQEHATEDTKQRVFPNHALLNAIDATGFLK